MLVIKNIIRKVKLTVLVALLCFFSFFTSYAQPFSSTYTFSDTISGVVIDSATKMVISHVTVELQVIERRQTMKVALTDENGFFKIIATFKSQSQLQFSFPGYKTITIRLPSYRSSSFHLNQVALVSLSKQLKEVQVSAKKPMIEQELGRITYNVDADPDSKTETAFELLRKIPLLTIDAEDNLQLNGSGNYRILINGRPSSLFSGTQSDIFKNFSASAIKTIEVITVPSARYEAAGIGGIINITTYKKAIGGYNGGVSIRASSPQGYSANSNVSINLGNISLSGNYTYTANTNPVNSSTFYRQDKLLQNHLKQIGRSKYNGSFQNWNSGLTWELNSLNLLTVGFSINNNNGKNNFLQQVIFVNRIGELVQMYNYENAGSTTSNGKDLSFGFQHNFKKNNEQQLTLAYRWSNSNSSNNSSFALQPVLNYKGRQSLSENKDGSTDHSLQIDYAHPIKKHMLELGVNAIRRQNNSNYFYLNQDSATGAFILDINQSNNFNYLEDIYAVYLSLNLRMDKWGLKTGARMEQANIDAHFVSTGTITQRKYRNIIPNITLSRKLKGISMINLSYTQRLQRPDLYNLDPYVDLSDPYNISYGNPALQPALAHVVNIGYNTFVKKTSFNISFFHQFTNNAIQQFTALGADTISRTTFSNNGKNKNFSLFLGLNTTAFKKLSINVNANANYLQYTINGKTRTNEGLTYNVSSSLNLQVKNWRAGSSLSYNAPNIMLQGKTAGYVSNSFIINRMFLKDNKANIGLQVSSPFREYRRSLKEIDDPAFYQLRESFNTIRRFTLSLSYRFSKVQGSTSRKGAGAVTAEIKAGEK